jgi:pyruvate dehydrogenase E2 component (dihydrolipoamide acetyltransferase)
MSAMPGGVPAPEEVVALSRIQRTIARRMTQAKADVPEFALEMDVDMEAAAELRSRFKAGGMTPVPSYNDLVVKACALALREFPRANASYRDDAFVLHPRVNVGIAVAARDALVVPTVFDADRKSIAEIAAASRELATKVRDGAIRAQELAGQTFTVSNLGMYGVRTFTAVINPPQSAILAVGAVEPRCVPLGGQVAIRLMATLCLSSDHRVLYGADAARFLGRVREHLGRPDGLTLGEDG